MKKTCWIITEGIAGTENQCLGIAEALGITPEVKRIKLRRPWKTLSPYFPFEQSWSFKPPLHPPFPDLVIASGRKSIAASRYIKKASGGKTFTVQIQDPRIPPENFDLVAVPAHDPTRGDNVIVTTAAPNRVTPERLEAAREQFAATLSPLPSPRVAVLIGGHSRAYRMTKAAMKKLCHQLEKLDKKGYGLMITASRRTGMENHVLMSEILADSKAYIWDGTPENPYFGYLGWADYILVTADSVSMLSEAATTGKPLYIIPMEGGRARVEKFHKSLIDKGIARMFEGKLESWKYEPLNDSELVADAIRKRMDI